MTEFGQVSEFGHCLALALWLFCTKSVSFAGHGCDSVIDLAEDRFLTTS